jgi:hypothetical protein
MMTDKINLSEFDIIDLELPTFEIFPDFKTGDLILFSNKHWWFAKLIERCTGSQFSHIGMVVENPEFLNGEKKHGVYILESTGFDHITDSEDGEYKFGVQMVPLRERLKKYIENEGLVFVRSLECIRTDNFYKKLGQAHSIVHNRPYDTDPQDWIKAKFDLEIGDVHNNRKFFCSALVAFIYVCLGLLREDTSWTIIKPSDFDNNKRSRLCFQNCCLGPLERIKQGWLEI